MFLSKGNWFIIVSFHCRNMQRAIQRKNELRKRLRVRIEHGELRSGLQRRGLTVKCHLEIVMLDLASGLRNPLLLADEIVLPHLLLVAMLVDNFVAGRDSREQEGHSRDLRQAL